MPAFTFTPDDYDPIAHRVELADQGLGDYCLAEVIGADGEARYALLKYSQGNRADYWPSDWARTAPHEVIDHLPIYGRD